MIIRTYKVWPTDAPADKNGYCVVAVEQERAGTLYCVGDYKQYEMMRHERVNMIDLPIQEKRYPMISCPASGNLKEVIKTAKYSSKLYDDLRAAHCAAGRDEWNVAHYAHVDETLRHRLAEARL